MVPSRALSSTIEVVNQNRRPEYELASAYKLDVRWRRIPEVDFGRQVLALQPDHRLAGQLIHHSVDEPVQAHGALLSLPDEQRYADAFEIVQRLLRAEMASVADSTGRHQDYGPRTVARRGVPAGQCHGVPELLLPLSLLTAESRSFLEQQTGQSRTIGDASGTEELERVGRGP